MPAGGRRDGGRIAVELNTHGLTGWNLWRLQKTLEGFCTLENDDHLIRRMRLVKSPAEIAYVRKAAALLDQSLQVVIETARPGVMDASLTAAYLKVVLEGGAIVEEGPHEELLRLDGRYASYCRAQFESPDSLSA